MSKPAKPEDKTKETEEMISWSKYSDIKKERPDVLTNCKALTDSIYNGLDLRIEILSVANQKLGDTILLNDNKNDKLIGLAVCHCGTQTQAGSNTCYVKFGLVAGNGDQTASTNFDYLLESCELFAVS